MKTLKLPKEKLDLFLAVLSKFGEVFAPLKKGENSVVFSRVTSWADVALDYHRTILPLKKYFLRPVEPLFRYDSEKGYEEIADDGGKRVIFGVHSCDIHGLEILDRVFSGQYPDRYYLAKRRSTAVIGIDCEPDDHCFCRSMGTDSAARGFDLFLSDIGDSYLVIVGTSLGDDMVLATGPFFTAMRKSDYEEFKRRSNERHEKFRLNVDISALSEILEMEYTSSIWEDLGNKCLSCGSCSMVCPTCYCFNMSDTVHLNKRTGERWRSWDSCLFVDHALVTGGINFRKDRSSRVKFRFYHKQRGFVAEYGRPSCVGCGRCITACPARIDIVEVIKRIRGEENATRNHRTAV